MATTLPNTGAIIPATGEKPDQAINNAAFTAIDTAFAKSLGTNGYQKLPGGLEIKWGQSVVPADIGYLEFLFPSSFPTATLQVQAGILYVSNNGGGAQIPHFITPAFAGKTGATLYVRDASGGIPNIDLTVSWLAIGH